MIFITGPMFSGKKEYVCRSLGWTEEDFEKNAVNNAHEWAFASENLPALADELSKKAVVIASEIGAGIVPVEKEARAGREKAGRLACMLAERADTVIRVCVGIPQCLKGELL